MAFALPSLPVTHNFSMTSVSNILFNTVQKRGYVDLHETVRDEGPSCCYGSTLPQDPTCTSLCTWTTTDPSTFLIRGKNYLVDRQKVCDTCQQLHNTSSQDKALGGFH